jgi:hypothetical protein
VSKKRTFREFRQGIYRPLNKEKCLNKASSPVVFRSNLEARLFKILDMNPSVVKWSSEQTIIPYINPIKSKQSGKQEISRYFVDAYMELKIDDSIKKYIVEIKPESQTKKPEASNRKKQSTILYENTMYAMNVAKWKAATEYAKKKNMDLNFLEGKK